MKKKFDMLKSLIYDPMFDGVYSKQFFRNVWINNYTSYIDDNMYGLVYFDLDGLGTANTDPNIGPEKADVAFKFLINLFQQTFPDTTTLSRIGGDEFVTFIPNADKELCEEYISRFHNSLDSAPFEDTKGLTITAASTDSTTSSNTYNMLLEASLKVDELKFEKKISKILQNISNNDYDTTVSRLTELYIGEFFKESRIPKNILATAPNKLKVAFYTKVMNTFSSLLNSSDRKISSSTDYSQTSEPTSYSEPLNDSELQYIYSIINGNSTTPSTERFVGLAKKLSVDSLTGFYTKAYFENFLSSDLEAALQKSKNSKCCLLNLDTVGLKLCNTILGHEQTDQILSNISSSIRQEKIGRPQDYVIDYGGGNFIIVLPNTSISNSLVVLNRILQKNSQSEDFKLLRFVSSTHELDKTSSFEDAVNITRNINFAKKSNIKYEQFINNPNIDKALELFLGNLLQQLNNRYPDIDTVSKKSELAKEVMHCVINYCEDIDRQAVK